MTACNCATHCPQSPNHEYACCRSQTCDCWCHQVVCPAHKVIVARATSERREAAERAYIEHRRICDEVGIEPASFGAFVAEWLECAGIEDRAKAQGLGDDPQAGDGSRDDYQARDYERMFAGQKGWE